MLSMKQVSKYFGGVGVLRGVDFELLPGEVHALVGENGAGKSTLMKVLAGVLQPDEGVLELNGAAITLSGVAAARQRGIVMVYQELMLVPDLSVAENLFLGNSGAIVRHRKLRERSRELLAAVELKVDPQTPVRDLGIGEQQLVEIASALALDSRVLIMDEPTAALSAGEAERLFKLIDSLKARGVSIAYISHRLEEIFRVADRVTVLRDGELVATSSVSDVTPAQIVHQMVGRNVVHFDRETRKLGEPVGSFEFEAPRLDAGRIELRHGEIVGLAGVIGSGRSKVLSALFGLAGTGSWNGQQIGGPRDALRRGLVLVPADRKTQGLVLELSVRHNLSLATLAALSRLGVMNAAAEKAQARHWIQELSLRPAEPEKLVREFSGGNQQKVVVGKMLATEPRVLLLDEPTRGVDVGARSELYELISQLALEGLGLIICSSDTGELTSLADRILVFRNGHVSQELHAPFNDEEVVRYVTGASQLA